MDENGGTLRLGTSSWSSRHWLGKLYPRGTKPADFITEYARRYSTVEIDSTFYAVPKDSTILGWRERTPADFLFASKVPQIVTHDKFLEDCEGEMRHYLKSMSLLGDKLGPILFQFPYYAKRTNVTEDEFLKRLRSFLEALPTGEFRFAVEVRNKNWINPYLCEILHDHGIALALIDHPWMSSPDTLFRQREIVTADFAYIRWLGDRKGIEKITTTWNEIIVDREPALKTWVPHIKHVLDQQKDLFGYVNNHYAGYAPDNVDYLKKLLA